MIRNERSDPLGGGKKRTFSEENGYLSKDNRNTTYMICRLYIGVKILVHTVYCIVD